MLKITHQDLLKLKPVEVKRRVLEVYLKNGGSISKTSRGLGVICPLSLDTFNVRVL